LPPDLYGLLEAFGVTRDDFLGYSLGWARAAPTLVMVPAFGLTALPAQVRTVLGVVLAATVAPAVKLPIHSGMPFAAELVRQALWGFPIAVSASAGLWAASMAGGLIDNLRGGREHVSIPAAEGATPMAAVFSLLASIAFLESGGPARVAQALGGATPDWVGPLSRSVIVMAHGIELALAIGAPVLVASVVIEVVFALVSRSAAPAHLSSTLAPLRSIALLLVAAVLFERMAELVVVLARGPV
jgi:type III secretory pathway component EscT